MEKSRKPKIRFKGYNDDWEQRKLKDLVDRVVRKNTNCESTLPLTISAQYGLVDQITYFNNRVASRDVTNYYLVLHGEFAYNKSTSDGYPFGAIKRLDMYEKGVLSTLYIVFVSKDKYRVNSDFLTIFFDTNRWHKGVAERAAEGARNHGLLNITADDFFDIDLLVPKEIGEQAKIGEFVQKLDSLITLHQRKLDKLINVKKSMLEKMFPKQGSTVPEIRFNGFTQAWEQRKLGDFGKATGGISIESEFSEDGIYKVISIGSYSENSIYNDQGIRAVKSDKTSNRVLNKNDLTMILNDKTTSGNIIGRVLLIEKSGIYVYNQRTERIEINKNEYDPLFLYEMLNAPNVREKIIKQAQGNTQIYVNWSAITMLDYMIPSKKEQVEIGQFLHSIGNLITLHQRKLEKLKNIKKSMLEKMFV